MTRRYEKLRRGIVDGAPHSRQDGKVVIVQGLWAWMQIAGDDDESRSRHRHDAEQSRTVAPPAAPACRPELVSVWADLLLGRLDVRERA